MKNPERAIIRDSDLSDDALSKSVSSEDGIQVIAEELERLKKLIPSEYDFTCCWRPHMDSKISGEVIGNTIYLYDQSLEKALRTLQHEYLDCIFTRKIIAPLTELVNVFIKLKEKDVYKEKERLIEVLIELM